MTSLRFFGGCVVLIATTVGCGRSDAQLSRQLLGTWEIHDEKTGEFVSYCFGDGGELSMTIRTPGMLGAFMGDTTFVGRWWIDGGALKVQLNDTKDAPFSSLAMKLSGNTGKVESAPVDHIDQSTLVIGGNRFQRVAARRP